METVIKILMRRDGLSREEAKELLNDTLEAVREAVECGDYFLAEDIFTSDLGLEPDYLMGLFL